MSAFVRNLVAKVLVDMGISGKETPMPRYFFDIHNDGQRMQDDEGSLLRDDRAAECEAIGALQEMSQSLILKNNQGELQASVRDEAGAVIFQSTLALRSERMK